MNREVIYRLESTPTEALSRAQKGLRELLRFYETGEMRPGLKANCPLCESTLIERECPWRIFTGGDCIDGGNKWAASNGVEIPKDQWAVRYLKESKNREWYAHRKRQIKSWMAQIAKEIESR